MKKLTLLVLLIVSLYVHAQDVKVVQFSELQEKILHTDSSLTVFNFWATWCGACIKELPHFDNLEAEKKDVKVYLVSIDFKEDFKRVKSFVAKRQLKSDILFLDEKDQDYFMRKISSNWSGSIPVTLFVNDLGETFFHEKAFSKEELHEKVNKYLN